MSKTMTESELRKTLGAAIYGDYDGNKATNLAKMLVGVTIVADPEPRPDFEKMGFDDLRQWIIENVTNRVETTKSGEVVMSAHRQLQDIANDIADRKGLAK